MSQMEQIKPDKELVALTTEALKVMQLSPSESHCRGAEDCSHQIARMLIRYLVFPTFVLRGEMEQYSKQEPLVDPLDSVWRHHEQP